MREKNNVWNVRVTSIITRKVRVVNVRNSNIGMEGSAFIVIYLNISTTIRWNANGAQMGRDLI